MELDTLLKEEEELLREELNNFLETPEIGSTLHAHLIKEINDYETTQVIGPTFYACLIKVQMREQRHKRAVEVMKSIQLELEQDAKYQNSYATIRQISAIIYSVTVYLMESDEEDVTKQHERESEFKEQLENKWNQEVGIVFNVHASRKSEDIRSFNIERTYFNRYCCCCCC
jgi:hypothetical protein